MTIKTKDIDAAAFTTAKTSQIPEVIRDYDGQAIFEFQSNPEVTAALTGFALGDATIDARRLLAARRRLFHDVRRVTGGVR